MGARALSTGQYILHLVMYILQTLILLAYIVCVIGLPFIDAPHNTEYTLFIWWCSILAPAFFLVASMGYALVMTLDGSSGSIMAIIDLILWVFSFAATGMSTGGYVYAWVFCDTNYVCDQPGLPVITRWRFMAITIITGVAAIMSALSGIGAFLMKMVMDKHGFAEDLPLVSEKSGSYAVGGEHTRHRHGSKYWDYK